MKRIIIAHVSKQHSFHTAVALKRAGLLAKYITTVYDKQSSLTGKVKKVLKGATLNKAGTRRSAELEDDSVLLIGEFFGLLRIFLRRFKKINIDAFVMDYFGRNVANYVIKQKPDAVILYDGVGKKYIDKIKKKSPNTKVIMDVTISSRLYMKEIFEEDMKLYGHDKFYLQEASLWNKEHMQNVSDDFRYCDFYLVPSEVVKRSLIAADVPLSKLIKVPYGVSVRDFSYHEKPQKSAAEPLRLLFVGGVMHRKGIHHLCELVSMYNAQEVILEIAGGVVAFEDTPEKYRDCENIKFLGFVTRDRIAEKFKQADVFILPSLGEGLALVILEALATGTPVLTSNLSGGNDAVINYENGIVYDYNNLGQLKDGIDWFRANRDKIPAMSKAARKTVEEEYTWEKYYQQLVGKINNILEINQ
ncbi:glycosyltransferase family 4 protein [Sphingobacterium deserti]|uniref:Glycosyl transferase group 1 n=1 Tax=Sphingobacterium deserti TaxID=1229276 RepID=A0A0B8T141_9SPHI|nr:glycosyltransferase family 4 protein [Sphingobacterium deserti]KGE14311.1 glycosyl transferase group 1 [Sphingobacterium deserti]